MTSNIFGINNKTVYSDLEEADKVAQESCHTTTPGTFVHQYVVQVDGGYVVRTYSELWMMGGPDTLTIVRNYESDGA